MSLLLLANIVVIAILSSPVPFRIFMNEPANRIIASLRQLLVKPRPASVSGR